MPSIASMAEEMLPDEIDIAKLTYDIRRSDTARGLDSLDVNDRAEAIERLARWHQSDYCGMLADGDLDALLLSLFEHTVPQDTRGPVERVLHIATKVYDVGGHSRIIRDWIASDPRSVGLAVTEDIQQMFDLPEGVIYATSVEGNIMERTKALVETIRKHDVDTIVIHHHPYDVVPFLALGHCPGLRSAIFGHGDHIFYIGSSLVDRVIDFRTCGRSATFQRRYPVATSILPFSFFHQGIRQPKDEKRIVLVAMASAYKFKQRSDYHFMRTMNELMRSLPSAELRLIGVDEEAYARLCDEPPAPNVQLLGILPDPAVHLDEAHYFIESFPFASLLSTIEAAGRGAVPIPAYGLMHDIYGKGITTVIPELDRGSHQWSEAEYLDFIRQEVASAAYRTEALDIIERHAEHHTAEDFTRGISTIYRDMEAGPESDNERGEAYEYRRECEVNWHRFSAYDAIKDFKQTVSDAESISRSQAIQVFSYSMRLKRSGRMDFSFSDIKALLRKTTWLG